MAENHSYCLSFGSAFHSAFDFAFDFAVGTTFKMTKQIGMVFT